MARLPRPLAAGLTYHLTARGNERRPIVFDDSDRRGLLRALGEVVTARAWTVGTYCVMPNHLHLVVRTPEPDLSDGVREVLGAHARRVNDRHERVGHLFQGRFHARVVTREAHHAELFRYLALNPVRAGLSVEPSHFGWSAHAALLGVVTGPSFLHHGLEPFDGDRERYATFVGQGGCSYLEDLVGDGSPERLRAARDAGFTLRSMEAVLPLSRMTIKRRIDGTRGPGAPVPVGQGGQALVSPATLPRSCQGWPDRW